MNYKIMNYPRLTTPEKPEVVLTWLQYAFNAYHDQIKALELPLNDTVDILRLTYLMGTAIAGVNQDGRYPLTSQQWRLQIIIDDAEWDEDTKQKVVDIIHKWCWKVYTTFRPKK